MIGGPAPPVESLLAHISSQLETCQAVKAEMDGEQHLGNTSMTTTSTIFTVLTI